MVNRTHQIKLAIRGSRRNTVNAVLWTQTHIQYCVESQQLDELFYFCLTFRGTEVEGEREKRECWAPSAALLKTQQTSPYHVIFNS